MDSTNWGDGMASRRSFGGCHSIHLSYGRTKLILQEYPQDGVIVWTVRVGTGMGMIVFWPHRPSNLMTPSVRAL